MKYTVNSKEVQGFCGLFEYIAKLLNTEERFNVNQFVNIRIEFSNSLPKEEDRYKKGGRNV